MHLSSSQVCVIRFYLFNGVFYQSLAGVTYNILAPPRRFAMAQLHFRAWSGPSLSSSLASHPQAPSGPFSVTQSYLTLCEPMNFSKNPWSSPHSLVWTKGLVLASLYRLSIRDRTVLGLPRWCSGNLPPVQETQETWVQSLSQEDSPGGRNGNPL